MYRSIYGCFWLKYVRNSLSVSVIMRIIKIKLQERGSNGKKENRFIMVGKNFLWYGRLRSQCDSSPVFHIFLCHSLLCDMVEKLEYQSFYINPLIV